MTIGSVAAHILALLHHLDFCRCRFDREILAVRRIDDAAHDNLKTAGCSLVIIAVIAVVDGDEANAHEWEGAFEVIPRLNVITREAGKIFDAYQVDLTMPDFLHQWFFQIPVCVGVVSTNHLLGNFPAVLRKVTLEECSGCLKKAGYSADRWQPCRPVHPG